MSEIRARRQAKGLTQAQLASRVGVQLNTIARYEAGLRHPRAETVVLLARALDCEVEDLVQEQLEKARAHLIARGAIGNDPVSHNHST
ncbi:MAG: helix-turn-helix transcriptional regulator [Oscillospiraceae bacterium]|nr:helix-turn-helix transcriptional regulator [Oscillospiraceae bacterium]